MAKVLVLRTCDKRMRSYGGFPWPDEGPVEAPDWDGGKRCCGGKLHGLLWGEGDAGLLTWPDGRWLVVEVETDDGFVDLGGKCGFRRGVVVHKGDRATAPRHIYEHGGEGRMIAYLDARVGDGGALAGGDWSRLLGGARSTVTGGSHSTVTGGRWSTVTGGGCSTVTGGDWSTVTGSHWSTVTGGDDSTVTGGDDSTVTGGGRSRVTGGDRSTVKGGYGSTVAGGYMSTVTGDDGSMVTGGDRSTVTGGDRSAVMGGEGSIVAGGVGAILIWRSGRELVSRAVSEDGPCRPGVQYRLVGGDVVTADGSAVETA